MRVDVGHHQGPAGPVSLPFMDQRWHCKGCGVEGSLNDGSLEAVTVTLRGSTQAGPLCQDCIKPVRRAWEMLTIRPEVPVEDREGPRKRSVAPTLPKPLF